MPTIQVLKKKLKGIRSTQKIARAMKTVSTVKFSQLNGVYGRYSEYSGILRRLYERYRDEYSRCFAAADPSAPECFVVIASNKGMCGSFNSELLTFAEKIAKESRACKIVVCGKKAEAYFKEKGKRVEKSFVFDDVPAYKEAVLLFDFLLSLLKGGAVSSVKLVYPHYVNMMRQTPVAKDLFISEPTDDEDKGKGEVLFFPDRGGVIESTADEMICAFLYGVLIESALGAQAATLMTMRSAYDTATEYSRQLESDINRKRQSQVTADVIETSAERPQEGL